MKKTVIKCTSRADWGRIIQWAEDIKPNCTSGYHCTIRGYYFGGFDATGSFFAAETVPSDYTILELSDFIAYPVKKYMRVSEDNEYWIQNTIVGYKGQTAKYIDSFGYSWKYAKPINDNKEKIDEIDRQIAELTKQKEELL